jgi:hypothetical protein
VRRLLALSLVVCALPAATASAHQGNPNFRSDVHGLRPATDGIAVEVLNRDDRLLLTNRSGKDVLIEGYSDEPYARLLADGTVQVNHNSAAYYLNQERDGQVPVPAHANGDSPTDWQTESKTGKFEWHDHRIHWMGKGTPPAVRDEAKLAKVDDWSVPVSVDGRKAAIAGTLWWTPRPGGGPPAGAIAAFVAVALVGLVAVVLMRRRRRGLVAGAGAGEREAW